MAFTSFRDTLERMRNDLASGNWRVKSYDIDGMQREFFSPAEFMQMLDYVERKAADEAARDTGYRRPCPRTPACARFSLF